jgi:heme-degrading monooxygenase HmoA
MHRYSSWFTAKNPPRGRAYNQTGIETRTTAASAIARRRAHHPSSVHRQPLHQRNEADSMYIAMNRFKVAPGSEAAFEHLWTTRDTHLKEVPGFVEFHLLKGPRKEDHVLYSSHTIWRDHASFEAWTKSDAFRAAHRSAGNENRVLYLGHPEFEGFEVIQTVK